MKRVNDKCLRVLRIQNKDYSLRATEHGLERMLQRKVSEEMVISGILSLGSEKLLQLKTEGKKTMIIDQINKITIVLDFKGNIFKILTVMNNVNVFIKNGQKVERVI